MSGSLIIEEIDVSDPIRVELAGDDAPHGRRYESAAWEEGGSIELGEDDGTRLPGRPKPIYHVLFDKFRPRVYRGALRDGLTGDPGHARQVVKALERIRRRANPVKVTWLDDTYEGLLVDANFGNETPGAADEVSDIRYELKFSVSEVYDLSDADPEPAPSTDDSPNLITRIAGNVAAVRANLTAVSFRAPVAAALEVGWRALEDTTSAVQAASETLESGTAVAEQRRAAVKRTEAAAHACSAAGKALADQVNELDQETALEDRSLPSRAAFEALRAQVLQQMLALRDAMRAVAIAARAKLQASARLYLVRDDDTLDSIALGQLGARSRAEDLGLTPAQLAAARGRYIRLPGA